MEYIEIQYITHSLWQRWHRISSPPRKLMKNSLDLEMCSSGVHDTDGIWDILQHSSLVKFKLKAARQTLVLGTADIQQIPAVNGEKNMTKRKAIESSHEKRGLSQTRRHSSWKVWEIWPLVQNIIQASSEGFRKTDAQARLSLRCSPMW